MLEKVIGKIFLIKVVLLRVSFLVIKKVQKKQYSILNLVQFPHLIYISLLKDIKFFFISFFIILDKFKLFSLIANSTFIIFLLIFVKNYSLVNLSLVLLGFFIYFFFLYIIISTIFFCKCFSKRIHAICLIFIKQCSLIRVKSSCLFVYTLCSVRFFHFFMVILHNWFRESIINFFYFFCKKIKVIVRFSGNTINSYFSKIEFSLFYLLNVFNVVGRFLFGFLHVLDIYRYYKFKKKEEKKILSSLRLFFLVVWVEHRYLCLLILLITLMFLMVGCLTYTACCYFHGQKMLPEVVTFVHPTKRRRRALLGMSGYETFKTYGLFYIRHHSSFIHRAYEVIPQRYVVFRPFRSIGIRQCSIFSRANLIPLLERDNAQKLNIVDHVYRSGMRAADRITWKRWEIPYEGETQRSRFGFRYSRRKPRKGTVARISWQSLFSLSEFFGFSFIKAARNDFCVVLTPNDYLLLFFSNSFELNKFLMLSYKYFFGTVVPDPVVLFFLLRNFFYFVSLMGGCIFFYFIYEIKKNLIAVNSQNKDFLPIFGHNWYIEEKKFQITEPFYTDWSERFAISFVPGWVYTLRQKKAIIPSFYNIHRGGLWWYQKDTIIPFGQHFSLLVDYKKKMKQCISFFIYIIKVIQSCCNKSINILLENFISLLLLFFCAILFFFFIIVTYIFFKYIYSKG